MQKENSLCMQIWFRLEAAGILLFCIFFTMPGSTFILELQYLSLFINNNITFTLLSWIKMSVLFLTHLQVQTLLDFQHFLHI